MQLGNDMASLAKRVSMFRDIPAPILGLLGAAAKWSEHRVGECICTSDANHVHAVITGSAWLLAPGWQIDKGSHASACIYAGELLDRIPTNCWLEARHKHTSVCHIAADRFQRAVASWPELAIRVQSAAWTREDHLLRLNSHLAASRCKMDEGKTSPARRRPRLGYTASLAASQSTRTHLLSRLSARPVPCVHRTLEGRATRKMASIARVVAATVTFVASVACAGPGTQAAPLGSVGPVVGTSEITYSLSSFAPTSVTEAIGQYRVTSRWAISDASHWRLDSHTLQPALQRHAETVVANGSSLTWYTSLYHTAWSIPQPSGATLGVLGMWEAGALASAIQGLVPPYFAHLESLGLHVRRLGSEVILGQVADAFEVSPLYRDAGRPYGRATLWLDSDYPLVLRLEMRGLKHSLGDPVHWVYRVTSITFGQGPSTEDLAYHPPVPATPPPTTFSGEGSSQGGRGVRWLVPAGFIPVGTPSAYVLSGTESEQDPAAGGTSEIAALFWHASTFLDVEEQLRFLALPASLKRGARVRAGACWIRSGHLRHSNLYWLALRRSHVALEILSNHLNQAQLTAYAGSEICR